MAKISPLRHRVTGSTDLSQARSRVVAPACGVAHRERRRLPARISALGSKPNQALEEK
jgi:hypothetical protein